MEENQRLIKIEIVVGTDELLHRIKRHIEYWCIENFQTKAQIKIMEEKE